MTAPMLGTKGQVRSIGICILLAIVTLGIYSLYWVYATHQELKEYSGTGIGGGFGVLIYFLLSLVTWFLLPNEVNTVLRSRGVQSRVSAMTGWWFFLPIIGAFVWFTKVQGQLNEFWANA